MTQIVTGNTKGPNFRNHVGYRLRNPITGKFLHLSGSGEVASETYAWLGFKHQARTLRDQAAARGDDWPYRLALPGGAEG